MSLGLRSTVPTWHPGGAHAHARRMHFLNATKCESLGIEFAHRLRFRMASPLYWLLLLGAALFALCHAREYSQWLLLPHESETESSSPFILDEPEQVAKSDWGEIRELLRPSVLRKHNVGLGFFSIEPKALLLPHYIDASFVFLVHKGSARLGWVAGDKLLSQDLKTGDIYAVPAGTVFYILNTEGEQRLEISGVYDTLEALESGKIESFFVAGGSDPKTVFSGFDSDVLGAAFKVSTEGVVQLLSTQTKGPIVPTSIQMYNRLTAPQSWSWKSFISDFLLTKKAPKAPKALSLFSKKRLFENPNGWFTSTQGKKVPLLKKSRLGVFAARLNAGALLAPHWNPHASVIGIVTNGTGTIQISYPNGTNALNQRLEERMVFFVPRYFPVSEIASEDGPLEFVGFTTSVKHHKHEQPQFLAGRNSVLNAVDMGTLALSFDIPQELLRSFLESQPDEIILAGNDDIIDH